MSRDSYKTHKLFKPKTRQGGSRIEFNYDSPMQKSKNKNFFSQRNMRSQSTTGKFQKSFVAENVEKASQALGKSQVLNHDMLENYSQIDNLMSECEG